MGDTWRNLEVNKGYQARGVIRQSGHRDRVEIIDMRGNASDPSAELSSSSLRRARSESGDGEDLDQRRSKKAKRDEKENKQSNTNFRLTEPNIRKEKNQNTTWLSRTN